MRGEACDAEGAGIPEVRATGSGGTRTGNGSVGVKGWEERLVSEGGIRSFGVAGVKKVPAGCSVFTEPIENRVFGSVRAYGACLE